MASVYLEGMNPQYCTGFENACVSRGGGGGGGGSCEKLVF